ncbi:hypothetical protein [Hamadaea tsunoensis]|uniref:hypothetical protein n=1 Tax=Hamadaea tsunoensis TaxID=53368 RepID=UPI0004167270|nr:hypothetical protein [Hamadaea tsunoensis]
MKALAYMRLRAFLRSGRALAPLLCAVALIGIAYGGGAATAGEAYAFTSVVIFPMIAWQTKIILDGEPDVQRRLARVAVGSAGGELAAGLVVAGVAALGAIVIALGLPWIIGGIKPPEHGTLAAQLIAGLWAHLLVVPPAVGIGALSSRALLRNAGWGALALVGGSLLAIVLGLKNSPVPFLAPPLMPAARVTAADPTDFAALLWPTLWGIAWSAVVLAVYARLRRTRA